MWKSACVGVYQLLHCMMLAQRRNRLTTLFSEGIPVVKRRISVFLSAIDTKFSESSSSSHSPWWELESENVWRILSFGDTPDLPHWLITTAVGCLRFVKIYGQFTDCRRILVPFSCLGILRDLLDTPSDVRNDSSNFWRRVEELIGGAFCQSVWHLDAARC